MSDEVLTGDLLSGGSAPPPPPVSTTTSSSQPSHSTINTTVRMEDVVSLTKQQLFNLREAIVISNDVLQWKQDWYPICLSGENAPNGYSTTVLAYTRSRMALAF